MDSSKSECALGSTSRRRIFSAPATASAATWSRNCSRARDTSWAISAFAAAFSRLPSSLAEVFASPIIWETRFSACDTISVARSRAFLISSSACRVEISSDLRPCSAAARPSAIVFCRASIARSTGGQTNLMVNQMKSANATACAISVRVKLIADSPALQLRSLRDHGKQRIGERKHHCQTHADDEGGVDQAKQQAQLRSEEHTYELQPHSHIVSSLLLRKKYFCSARTIAPSALALP